MTRPEPMAAPSCEHSFFQKIMQWPALVAAHFGKKTVPVVKETQIQPPAGLECVFVSGVMRSGTTLLQRVVAHSLDSQYIREESTLRIPIESFQVLEQYQAFEPIGRAAYVEQYQSFLSGLLHAIRREINGGTLVLKDPLALKSIPTFIELMPRTKFIISIRNPMSTAASIYRVRNRQRKQGKQSFITPMDFGDIVEYIARLCEVIIAVHEKDNVCLVKYEELIGHNPAVLKQLSSFIGARVKLNPPDDSFAYDADHAFWTPESGQDIKNTSLDKYRSELSVEEKALVAAKLARFNTMFGYTAE